MLDSVSVPEGGGSATTLHRVNFSFQDRASWEVSVTDCSQYEASRADITICHQQQSERPLTVLNTVSLTVFTRTVPQRK